MKYYVILLIFLGSVMLAPNAFATHDPSYHHSMPFGFTEPNYQFIDFSHTHNVGEPIKFILEKARDSNCNSYNVKIIDDDGNFIMAFGAEILCAPASISSSAPVQTKIGYKDSHPIIIMDSGKYYLEVEFEDIFIKREFVVRQNTAGGTIDKIVHPILSPLKQFKSGISINEIQCRNSLQIMLMHDGIPACIKLKSIEKLLQRGFWYVPIDHSSQAHFKSASEPATKEQPDPSAIENLLIQNQIDYLSDKLVVTSGISFQEDSGCGAVIDTDSVTHWFGIDSISKPTEITLFSENPNMCKVNTSSCFCSVQMKLTALTLDELSYFTIQDEEKFANILIDYLSKENINRTPKFQIGKLNINYTDSSAMGYCGEIWGTNTYGFFDGAIVNDIVMDYGISKELPLLCAISDDVKWWERK